MSPTLSLAPSGIPAVDAKWGGLTKGGTYLLVGHAHAGRPRHLMATIRAAVDVGETCLLISARPQAALIELAAEIGFDLPRASQTKQVRLMKSPPGKDLAALGDGGLSRALVDLGNLARTHKAGRVMMDDFSSFVQFRDFDSFAAALRRLILDAASLDTTFVLGLGEPANDASTKLLRFVQSEVAGTIHTTSDGDDLTRFALHAGTGHRQQADEPPSTFEEPAPAIEESAPVEPRLEPQDSVASPEEAFPPPPFELSIPVPNGGDGSNEMVGAPTPTRPPPGLDAPLAVPTSDSFATTTGDTAWASITPVSFEGSPLIVRGPGSFLDDTSTFGRLEDLQETGYYVDSAEPEATTPLPKPDAPADLDEAAASVQRAAYPELFRPITQADPSANFKQALADAFEQRASTPFLIMAMRIAADDPYANVFPAVTEGVRIGVGQSAMMLSERGRLIALIPHAGADVARNVFAILKSHLKTIVPNRADAALQHVNAMAVPNGEPFKTADELFDYAYGG